MLKGTPWARKRAPHVTRHREMVSGSCRMVRIVGIGCGLTHEVHLQSAFATGVRDPSVVRRLLTINLMPVALPGATDVRQHMVRRIWREPRVAKSTLPVPQT